MLHLIMLEKYRNLYRNLYMLKRLKQFFAFRTQKYYGGTDEKGVKQPPQ